MMCYQWRCLVENRQRCGALLGCHGTDCPLARRVDDYKRHLAACDMQRRNDLDGRGHLSEEELAAFTRFFLETCIDQITFKALHPDDIRAADLWEFVTQVDISDQITVTRAHPGGGGFSAEVYFVEGIAETWRPLVADLDTGYPFVEMTLDLSPATYWTTPIP